MIREIYIKSSVFEAYPNEEEEINPGRFGKKLAEFIKQNLKKNGIQVTDMYPTDYAYELRLDQYKFSVYIVAGNIDGESDLFLVSLEPKKEYVRKFFKKISTADTINPIFDIILKSFESNSDILVLDK